MLMVFIMIKPKIEYVEVIPSVDCAYYWHSVDEMVREFVAVALNNTVDCSCRNILYQLRNLIRLRTCARLGGIDFPYAISVISIAVVPYMAQNDDSVCPCISQPFAALNDHRGIVQKLIGRKGAIIECGSFSRSFNRG